MKRRYFAILLMAALLVSCFAVSALATQAQLNYVTDEAGLFHLVDSIHTGIMA